MKIYFLSLWLLATATTVFGQASLHLRVRSQETHVAVPAAVLIETSSGSQWRETDATGALEILLFVGERVELTLSAAGFHPLTTYFIPEFGQDIQAEVLLDPLIRATQTDVVDRCRITGYVSDAQTGQPLAGALVETAIDDEVVTTNAEGFFQYETHQFAAISAPSVAPMRTKIRVHKPGYGMYVMEDFLLTPGGHTVVLSLERGNARFSQKQVNGLLDRQLSVKNEEETEENLLKPENVNACTANASIRVGTSCSCNTCTGVSVMSLEAYVESGLDNEWISSWASNSLKAGSVAYRSYGAYYTTHPHNGTYDLASSTCRQVWGAETATSCINAARATAGEVLMQNGTTARSEYSAENNAFACADGYTGSPTLGWPCNADNVCLGKTASGHGRGMCQWGSQRWASGQSQLYTWILDHYYTIGGVTRCTLGGSTSVEKLRGNMVLTPNPATDFLTITATRVPTQVLLHNSLGQKVFATNELMIDVSRLPKGLYFVTLVFADGIQSSPLQVQ